MPGEPWPFPYPLFLFLTLEALAPRRSLTDPTAGSLAHLVGLLASAGTPLYFRGWRLEELVVQAQPL